MVQISLIIPHFNSIDSLNRLLETIPCKEEIQIIVVDDNSTNCLSDFIKIKNDSRFRHVMFISNSTGVKGAGVCRNIGIDLAKGNWIIFADSDDFFLREFYDILQTFCDSSNDIIFFRPTSYEVDSGKISDRHIFYENIINEYLYGNSDKGELLLRYAFHVPWSKMINTKFIKNNKIYFDSVIAANDVMFSVKSGHLMNKFAVSEKIIYCVTKNKGSLTMNMSENVFDSRLSVHIKYYQFLRNNLTKRQLKDLEVRGSLEYIRLAIKNGYSFKKVIKTYMELRKNKLNIISIGYFNPIFIIRKLVFHYKYQRVNKKYLVNHEKII